MGNKPAIALFGMSGLLVLFAAYASLLPDVLESKAQVEINANKSEVINYLSNASNWDEWLFPESVKEMEDWKTLSAGKSSGEGSVIKWFSEAMGDGGLEIKAINSNEIIFERISDNNAFRDRGYLNIEGDTNGVVLSLLDSLDISTNFIARYEAQDESYLSLIDSSNVEVLTRLKSILESK